MQFKTRYLCKNAPVSDGAKLHQSENFAHNQRS